MSAPVAGSWDSNIRPLSDACQRPPTRFPYSCGPSSAIVVTRPFAPSASSVAAAWGQPDVGTARRRRLETGLESAEARERHERDGEQAEGRDEDAVERPGFGRDAADEGARDLAERQEDAVQA